jgi:alkylation response protein AidB-like acyl-CoA dehydrogenase
MHEPMAATDDPVAQFLSAVAGGRLELPLPGSGRTGQRMLGLAALGRQDLVLARLCEGHLDAQAILAELGRPAPAGDTAVPWGVWAAVPNSVAAVDDGERWRLTGTRPWCSGAASCAWALVTAAAADGVRLFAVDLAQPDAAPVDGTWPAVGMAQSDSRAVRFDDVIGYPVGQPGEYVQRPGFWHGGVGVAACWYGGAAGIADTLLRTAGERDLDAHALAHLGAVDAALNAARTVLLDAAARIDAAPTVLDEILARRVRAIVEASATTVLDHVGRALGAGPLCQDAAHAHRVADLTVYLRQSHAEADLAGLGAAVAHGKDPGW